MSLQICKFHGKGIDVGFADFGLRVSLSRSTDYWIHRSTEGLLASSRFTAALAVTPQRWTILEHGAITRSCALLAVHARSEIPKPIGCCILWVWAFTTLRIRGAFWMHRVAAEGAQQSAVLGAARARVWVTVRLSSFISQSIALKPVLDHRAECEKNMHVKESQVQNLNFPGTLLPLLGGPFFGPLSAAPLDQRGLPLYAVGWVGPVGSWLAC